MEVEILEGFGGFIVGCIFVGYRRIMALLVIEEGIREVEG